MCKAVTVPFFKHLAKSLAKNKEEEKPLFSQDEKKFERTPCEEENQLYFENTEEVNSFWRRLWQTEAKDNMHIKKLAYTKCRFPLSSITSIYGIRTLPYL